MAIKKSVIMSLGIALGFAVLVMAGRSVHAATSFVSNITVRQADTEQIRLCWNTADASTSISPKFTYQVAGVSTSQLSVSPSNLTTGGNGNWCGTANALAADTEYTFWIEYNSTTLSQYLDYVPGGVVSVSYSTRTARSNLQYTVLDKSYVLPGEKVRLYATNLGSQPSGTITAKLGASGQRTDGAGTTATITDDVYNFSLSAWGNNYLEFTVPDYNADKKFQSGKLFPNKPFATEANYEQQIMLRMLQSASAMPRPVLSGYKGTKYRSMVNASIFRYGVVRTSAKHGQEGTVMISVRKLMKSLGRGVDALKQIIYTDAEVYGGYSETEVSNDIRFGPGCVHMSIPQAIWQTTTDYQACMDRAS